MIRVKVIPWQLDPDDRSRFPTARLTRGGVQWQVLGSCWVGPSGDLTRPRTYHPSARSRQVSGVVGQLPEQLLPFIRLRTLKADKLWCYGSSGSQVD